MIHTIHIKSAKLGIAVWRLCLAALLLFVVNAAANAYGFEAKNDDGVTIYYNILSSSERTCEVTYGGTSYSSALYSGSVNIPETAKSFGIPYTVTSIGEYALYHCSGLTSVTIPNSVTSIGINAFKSCSGLTSVIIGNSVTEICDGAFSLCSGLTGELTIPNSVTEIGKSAFNRCSGLTGELTIPENVREIGSYAFNNCSGLTGITIDSSVTTIGDYAFYGCTELTVVNFNATACTYAGSNGDNTRIFSGCDNITTFNFGENVTMIPAYLCYNLTSLTGELTIPNSVTEIGQNAFYNCSGLTEVAIGNGVTSIGNFAFSYCSGLTQVTIPARVTSIGNEAFSQCKGLTKVTIGEGMTEIGDYAFWGCSGLTEIIIPENVTTIGSGAFSNCSGLKQITIPDGITEISNAAFYYCTGLTEITIPNSVTEIGSRAFYQCTSLKEVSIPNSVTTIGDYAFYYCTGLTSIISLNPEPPTCGGNVFNNVDKSNCTLYVPIGSKEKYAIADQWKDFIKIVEITSEVIEPTVQTYRATEIGYDSALLRGSVAAGVAKITEQGFEYWTEDGNVQTIEAEGEEMSVTLTGLTPETTYYYKAYATTALRTIYGEEEAFTTTTFIPISVVTNKATDITATTATLHGSVTTGSDEITEQGFEYWASGGKVQTATATGEEMAVTLTGLEDGVTYTYRAYAITENHTVYGEEMTFTTIKAPTVQTYEATEITYNSALIAGFVTAGEENVLEYGFEYWYTDGDVITVTCTGEEMSVTITGLKQGTQYSYRAYAKTESGTTYGEEMTFATETAVPPTVQTYEATDVTYNSATLNGYVEAGDEEILECGFEYWTTAYDVQTITSTGGNLSIAVANLMSSSSYDSVIYTYRAYATTESGTTYGEEMTFTTEILWQPDFITHSAMDVTSSSATLQGSASANTEEILEQGFVFRTESGEEYTIEVEGEVMSVTITGLEPSTTYYYCVYARTESKTWYGGWIKFTTLAIVAPTVQTVSVTNVTSTTATLHGSVTEGEESILEQGFEYWGLDGNVETVTASGSDMSVTLTGLEDGVTYTYRAYARTESGTTYGEEMTFKAVTAPTVQTFAVTDVTESSAVLKGQVTAGSEDVLGQGFEYWAEGGEIQTIAMAEQTMEVTLSGLEQGTTYTYRAYAITASATTYGVEVTFTTQYDMDGIYAELEEAIEEMYDDLKAAWTTITTDYPDAEDDCVDYYDAIFDKVMDLTDLLDSSYRKGNLYDDVVSEIWSGIDEGERMIEEMLEAARKVHETGIEDILANCSDDVRVYNLAGSRIHRFERGNVYIFLYSDGTTKKVLVK